MPEMIRITLHTRLLTPIARLIADAERVNRVVIRLHHIHCIVRLLGLRLFSLLKREHAINARVNFLLFLSSFGLREEIVVFGRFVCCGAH